jgi:hypothetical protein
MKFLGKLLFPNSLPFEQRKKVQLLMVSIIVGLAFATTFVIVALKVNREHTGF